MAHKALNWHPWFINPLDRIGEGHSLTTPDGTKVVLGRDGMAITVQLGDKPRAFMSDNNIAVCHFLNAHEVGEER